MSVLAWEEPPPAPPKPSKWQRVTDELGTKPGEWARVAERVTYNRAAYLSRHLRIRYGLETQKRALNGGRYRSGEWAVWARCQDAE